MDREGCYTLVVRIQLNLRVLTNIGSALPLVLLMGCGSGSANSGGGEAPGFFGGGWMAACSPNTSPLFTQHLTDLSQVDYLDPWGKINGGSLKGHTYLHNRYQRYEGGRPTGVARVPVYAPVDSYLISYAHYREGDNTKSDFMFVLQVSCEVAYRLDHIDQLSGVVAERLGATPVKIDDSRTTVLTEPIRLVAGTLIGTTIGTPQGASWDFGVYNTRNNNPLTGGLAAYAGTGEGENYRYADCPYDYFPEAMRQSYYAKLTSGECGPAN